MADIGIITNYAFLLGAILLAGALSGYLAEKVGIINIGIDGMMCFGALFFAVYSSPVLKMSTVGPGMIFIPIILTMISTTICGLMHAFATIKLKANHIISGTAINLIGVALATFLNAPLGSKLFDGSTRLQSGFNDFLYVGNSIYGSSIIMFLIVILITIGIYFVMNYTKVGLRYRAIGENPNAVDSQGINVFKYQYIGTLLSSMLAGLAGALFMFNVKQFSGNTQGYGFLALAIMIAGAWKIEWISLASICFAIFTALSTSSVLTNLGVPRAVSFSLPYVITLLILICFSKWIHPPKHEGIPFDKAER